MNVLVKWIVLGSIKHPSIPPAKRWKIGPGRGGGGRGRGAGPNSRVTGPPGSKNVLPSKFLLGGNINDPLNLNSLNDERISRVVNAVTPESSPLPTPVHRKEEYKIEVLIPPNISDPLNLNADDDSDYESKLISPHVKRKKTRHRKRPRKIAATAEAASAAGAVVKEGEEGHDGDISDSEDEEPVSDGAKAAGKSTEADKKTVESAVTSEPGKATVADTKNIKSDSKGKGEGKSQFKEKNEKFQYGNYNQYYGYRNPGNIEDLRLQYFKSVWFEEKEVLDIGCNVGKSCKVCILNVIIFKLYVCAGHITISIAKNFAPQRIVGIDIDKKLIQIASKNVKHYLDTR